MKNIFNLGLRHLAKAIDPKAVAAGRLSQGIVPTRHGTLRNVPLAELSGELLARIEEGSFTANGRTILLGSQIYDALEVALDVHNNRVSRRRYRDLFGAFYKNLGPLAPTIEGTTVVDLGCGSINPYGLLFLFLMLGARRGIAIDLDEFQDVPSAVRALADCAAMMLIDPSGLVGNYPITREQVLRNIASFDLTRMRAGDSSGLDVDRLSHRQESVFALSLGDGEADVVISNAFLEHVRCVDEAVAEFARITRMDGLGVHTIDGTDHRRYQDPNCHPLEFLKEANGNAIVHGSNRIRPTEFVPLFERHGFKVISVVPCENIEVSSELRERLAEPFRSMPNEVLSVVQGKLVVRRVG